MNNPSTSSGQRLPSGTGAFLFTDIESPTKLAQLDKSTCNAAWAEGRPMKMEQAIAYALEETNDVKQES